MCLNKFSNLSKLCTIQLYTYLIYVPSNASVNRQAVYMIRDLTVIPTLLAKPHTVLGRVELQYLTIPLRLSVSDRGQQTQVPTTCPVYTYFSLSPHILH